MSTWVTLSATDLDDVLVAAQSAALRSSALAVGQADPFAVVMQDRCNYIRNRLAGRVQISATPYAVPPELRSQALFLILESLQARLAPALKLKDDQVSLIKRAYADLDLAGTEDLPITTPDDPSSASAQQQSGNISVVSKPARSDSRASYSGL